MDFKFSSREPAHRRSGVAPWMLAALIGIILGTAALAAAMNAEGCKPVERPCAFHGMRAL
jgi:hypothetical protein